MGPPARKKMAVEATPAPYGYSSSSTAPNTMNNSTNYVSNNTNTNTSSETGNLHDTPTPTMEEIRLSTLKLANELNAFCASHTFQKTPSLEAATVDTAEQQTVLQLAVCRKLRELLPTTNCAALLQTAQQQHWIPVLLQWLNIHDRPAVQLEALLAVTNIAEVCAQTTTTTTTTTTTGTTLGAPAVTTAAAAAAAAAAAWPSLPLPGLGTTAASAASFQEAMEAANKYTNAAAAAAAAAAAHHPVAYRGGGTAAGASPFLTAPPGSVPFPPLSFRQTLSPEAVAAFEQTIQTSAQDKYARDYYNNNNTNLGFGSAPSLVSNNNNNILHSNTAASTNLTAPLFPSTPTTTTAHGGTNINFASLAPPPPGGGGAHSSSIPTTTTNAFVPPPTPVANAAGSLSFPQQLSASSQHLLLRHADAIPTLIQLLSSPSREVYEQAMWILGSIAAGDGGGGAALAGGSNSNTNNTSNSNNATEKQVAARDVILAAGVMQHLLQCLEAHPTNLSLQRIGSWTLSNLLDNIFQQPSQSSQQSQNSGSTSGGNKNLNSNDGSGSGFNNMSSGSSKGSSHNASDYSSADKIDLKALLPVLNRLLHMSDSEVLSYVCWSLSHLCDHASHIAQVVNTTMSSSGPTGGLVPRLVELLTHPSWRVTKPALRTIGNIVCAECSDDGSTGGGGGNASAATTDYTETILECGAVPRLKELITHSNREIQKEAAWTLSNIAAGTVEQIQAVIDSGAIPPLVKLVRDKKTDQEVRSEACWVVLNATSCGSDSQIEVLVDEGCVSVLGVLLSEASMVMMALEGLERVLQVEETRELIRRQQIDAGELEDDEDNRTPVLVSASLIEKARESHTNGSAVTKRADRIWRQHFVSCALCKKSFSKHRTADASFCEECKCHVCCNCNCKIYHLDYQEELWAATEEQTEAKKNAKKSKNKKKKAKLKEKKANKHHPDDGSGSNNNNYSTSDTKDEGITIVSNDAASTAKVGRIASVEETNNEQEHSSSSSSSWQGHIGKNDEYKKLGSNNDNGSEKRHEQPRSVAPPEEEEDDEDDDQNQIDLVLYLQQTGSIIALSKLMDALEYGGEDYDDELDEYERKMIREQQSMRRQATN